MLRVEMLPADRGDCLLIEYGATDEVEYRVLIDGGHANAYEEVQERLLQVPTDAEGRRQFELLVITHIDGDHVDGDCAAAGSEAQLLVQRLAPSPEDEGRGGYGS